MLLALAKRQLRKLMMMPWALKKSTKVCQLQTHLNSQFTVFSQTVLMMMCIQNYNFTSLIETIRNAAFCKVSLCLVFLR